MDKLIKKEVLTLWISQLGICIVSVTCAFLPLIIESTVLIEQNAEVGNRINNCILFIILTGLIICKYNRIFEYSTILAREVMDNIPLIFDRLEINCYAGLFNKIETEKCKERYRKTLDYLYLNQKLFYLISFLLPIIVCVEILFSIINYKINTNFSNYTAIATFFIILQTACLFISSKFIQNTIKQWLERLRRTGISEDDFDEIDTTWYFRHIEILLGDELKKIVMEDYASFCDTILQNLKEYTKNYPRPFQFNGIGLIDNNSNTDYSINPYEYKIICKKKIFSKVAKEINKDLINSLIQDTILFLIKEFDKDMEYTKKILEKYKK